ncbi:MAG: hypothetical protein R3A79_07400 [Nannocystaceae bacterium]
MLPMRLLATMTPWRYAASDPHPRRPCPPPAEVAEALARELGASPLPGDGPLRLALDVADGRNLLVRLGPERVEVYGDVAAAGRRRDDEHGGWVEDGGDATFERSLEALVPVLVRLTGWRAASDLLLYDPDGRCPACGRCFYDWESACRDCGARLDGSVDPADSHRRAARLIDAMVAAELLELEHAGDRGDLERRLSEHIRRQGGAMSPERVLGILEDAAAVAEVYGDEDDLRRQWDAL